MDLDSLSLYYICEEGGRETLTRGLSQADWITLRRGFILLLPVCFFFWIRYPKDAQVTPDLRRLRGLNRLRSLGCVVNEEWVGSPRLLAYVVSDNK